MAELNLKYYTNQDFYSDGDIENEILDFVKSGKNLEDIPKEDINYHLIYHLSEIRKNILNWYPFEESANILEIGSGCGAITGLLCEKAHTVYSVELSKRRATINYERNKKYQNLNLYVGNIGDMEFEHQFDYIVLNGVFEYAMSFTDTETPYITFLNGIKRFLKTSGKVMIAIENRLGLKYLAGAPEDHTGMYFLGVDGYKDNSSVRTFTKKELTDIVTEVGLKSTKFYYPYPDYKFPSEIYTDESIVKNGYGKDYYNLNSDRFELFDEGYVARSMVTEGIADVFANSFLMVAGFENNNSDTPEVIYAKMNCDRGSNYRIITTIERRNRKLYVYKTAMNEVAKKHIDRVIQNSHFNKFQKISNVQSIRDDVMCYDFLDENTLDDIVSELIRKGDIDGICQALSSFFELYFADASEEKYKTEEFEAIFGITNAENVKKCIKPCNIDLICSNIFVTAEQQYKIIDCEWTFDIPIPIDFIVWRNINELYTVHSELAHVIHENVMLERFGINVRESESYREWTLHFVNEYVKVGSLEKYSIPKMPLSINDIATQERNKNWLESIVYYDDGTGYSEDKKILAKSKLQGEKFHLLFDMSGIKGIQAVRWDPAEGIMCKIEICEAKLDDYNVQLISQNAINAVDGVFLNIDPNYQVILDGQKEYAKLSIIGSIHHLTNKEVELYNNIAMQEKQQLIDDRDKILQQVRLGMEIKANEIENLNRVIENLNRVNEVQFHKIEQSQSQHDIDEKLIVQKEAELKQLTDRINHIESTKGYRALQYIRHIKDKIVKMGGKRK